MHAPARPARAILPALLAALALAACSTSRRTPDLGDVAAGEGGSGGPTNAAPAAAMIDGATVSAASLWPRLAEASGATVLREAVLDRAVEIEAQRRGVRIDARAIDAERQLLVDSLSQDGDSAIRLLDEVRRRDGLGPTRFAALLRRNATLRALVLDQVQVTDESLRTAHDMAAGPKRQVRVFSAPSLGEATAAVSQVRGGASFADLAAERSSDESAARGGLLAPFSRSDPSYPESLRAAAFALPPGEVSSPILLPQGYVVLMLVRELPATGQSIDSMRAILDRSVRLTQERLLMDQLARRLARDARVTVFDEGLAWAWDEKR